MYINKTQYLIILIASLLFTSLIDCTETFNCNGNDINSLLHCKEQAKHHEYYKYRQFIHREHYNMSVSSIFSNLTCALLGIMIVVFSIVTIIERQKSKIASTKFVTSNDHPDDNSSASDSQEDLNSFDK